MTCPSCNNPKEHRDFYWRGESKVHKNCKECISKRDKEKRRNKGKVKRGIFNIEKFANLMRV